MNDLDERAAMRVAAFQVLLAKQDMHELFDLDEDGEEKIRALGREAWTLGDLGYYGARSSPPDEEC